MKAPFHYDLNNGKERNTQGCNNIGFLKSYSSPLSRAEDIRRRIEGSQTVSEHEMKWLESHEKYTAQYMQQHTHSTGEPYASGDRFSACGYTENKESEQ